MSARELTELEEYARQTRELAEAVLADPPPGLDPAVRAQVEAVEQLARQTEAQASGPVKIGVVGRFNAGKTLLLGGLVGFADGIPVKPVPTTGNVTALHFAPSNDPEEVHTTRFENFVVEFLDQASARACLGEMLAEARRLAPQARLTATLIDALAAFDPDDKRSLTGLEAWCRGAWAGSEDYAPLRMLLRELVWFVRAYLQCGEALCNPAQRYPIPPQVAQDGLSLDIPDEVRSLRFDDLPPAPRTLTSAPDKAAITPEFLRSVFPLIARLRVDVVVARGIWDLRPLKGTNDFILLDFPGLGAAFSGVRDRFLCRRELGEIQTILLLLNSKEPGGGGWNDIFTPLAEKRADFADCILVGVSLFDCLKLTEPERKWLRNAAGLTDRTVAAALSIPSFSGDTGGSDVGQTVALGRLRGGAATGSTDRFEFGAAEAEPTSPAPPPPPNGESLTEAKLLDGIVTLKAAVSVAESMVPSNRRDRIVLLSPILYLKKLADEDTRLAVATPEFMPELLREGEEAVKAQELWQAVARRIRADDPTVKKDGLTRWLEQFAADGGIGALRALIESHVSKHGLRQLTSDVEEAGRKLRQSLERLSALLPKPVGPTAQTTDPDRVQAVREAIRNLRDHYRTTANQVRQGLVLQVERNGTGVSVSQLIDEEAVSRVYGWPHWDNLLQSLQNGYVVEGKTGGGFGDEPEEPAEGGGIDWGDDPADDTTDDDTFPTRSEDFFGVFERTLSELQEFTRQQIEAGVEYWLRQVGEPVSADRRELTSVLANSSLATEIKRLRLGKRNRGTLEVLRAAVDPPQIKRHVFPAGDAARLEMDRPLDPARLFPQARSSGPNDTGRVYGWARKLKEHKEEKFRPDPNLAHQAQVIRLRDEFVTVISQEMTQTVSLVLKKLNQKISEVLADLWLKLARAENHTPVIDTLVRGGAAPAAATAGAAADPLVLVRQLAAIPWPLAL